MPVARESVPVIGPDSIMSSALPAGELSKMSVRTTSASSLSTMRCAVVEPTNPPPTTVTFFLIPKSSFDGLDDCEFDAAPAAHFAFVYSALCSAALQGGILLAQMLQRHNPFPAGAFSRRPLPPACFR